MPEQRRNTFSILLAGGTGTRLWPLSREHYPKQLVKFIEKESLVQATAKRLIPVLGADRIRIVCGEDHAHEMERHIEEIGVQTAGKIITEPCARNTAPAILLAVIRIMDIEKDAVCCVFPADHVIKDTRRFHQKLTSAITLAQAGHVVTFGIMPEYPETGYGYIEGNGDADEGALYIKRFVEKPDLETAKTYIADGNFFWNSGMFAFRASVMIEEFKKLQPDLLEQMRTLLQTEDSVHREGYERLQKISIDYAIMEKTAKGVVLPSDFGWSDIGTWKSLYDFLPKDENNNMITGDVIARHTENCLLMGQERLVAANRLKNTVVVETPDAVFVSDINHSREADSFVDILEKQGRNEHRYHKTVYHPWGTFTPLERKEGLSVARIMVYPGAAADLPRVPKAMHLIAIQGKATIRMDTHDKLLNKGESTVIHNTDTVVLENPGNDPLELVQVECDA